MLAFQTQLFDIITRSVCAALVPAPIIKDIISSHSVESKLLYHLLFAFKSGLNHWVRLILIEIACYLRHRFISFL